MVGEEQRDQLELKNFQNIKYSLNKDSGSKLDPKFRTSEKLFSYSKGPWDIKIGVRWWMN